MKNWILCLCASFLLTGCLSYDLSRKVVQQGNLLPKSKVERLKVGQSKEEVAILMGSSLLSPTFNLNRWDYAYTLRIGGGPMLVRHVSLYFKNDRVVRIVL